MKFQTAAISLVLVSALGGCIIVADGDDKPAFTSTFDPAVSSPGTVFGAAIRRSRLPSIASEPTIAAPWCRRVLMSASRSRSSAFPMERQ